MLMHNQTMAKDKRKVADALAAGKGYKEALIEGGYSESTANRGKAGVPPDVFRMLIRRGVDLAKDITPAEQESFVRSRLLENAMEGSDKAVQSLKLLGQDRRVNMFTAESQTGIIVIQSPVPTATDSLQLEDKPTTLLGE